MPNNITATDQDSLNFLWFSYFNITKEEAADNMEDAMDKCIQRAYRDVCRTFHYAFSGRYLERIKKLDKDKYEEYLGWKEGFRKEISTYIAGQIGELKIQSQEDFEKWHSETCDEIILKAKNFSGSGKQLFAIKDKNGGIIEGETFFYGQAQKWLNMTLKYMLIMGVWDEDIREKKKYFHVPVDSFTMEAASAEGIKIPHKIIAGSRIGAYSEYRSRVWSQWGKEEYSEFQKALREKLSENNIYPMEWELSAWIDIAKTRESKV